MIVVKVPMRISFMGGGTDLPGFFHKSEGRVLSATINKYVVLVINPTPMNNKISIRYSVSETVDSPEQIQNTRVRAAFLDLGIKSNIEVGSFASIPAKIGLGSSSSFSVALIMGLYDYLGKRMTKSDIAEAACRLEIELVKEPIGKQDQYAATFGGFNVFTFNPDDSVNVEPIIIDFQKRKEIEKHAILFFMGLKREADISLKESFFIGDSTRDIQTGKNAKTKTILVETGYAGKDRGYDVKADFKVKNLPAAVKVVKRYV